MHLMALGDFDPAKLQTAWSRRHCRLNAPYGARCFLTRDWLYQALRDVGLNAPYGARCFLTGRRGNMFGGKKGDVLMHLMRSVLSDGSSHGI